MLKTVSVERSKRYDWIVDGDAYLAIALLACKHFRTAFADLEFRSTHPFHELLYPIVFNFKQGLEIYIKGLGAIDAHGEYTFSHDLKLLIDENVKKVRGTKSESIWNKLKTDIWPTCRKYYYGTYITSNPDENHPDTKNEAERYPEAGNKNCYSTPDVALWGVENLFDPFGRVGTNEIEKVNSDIRKVRSSLEQAKRDILKLNPLHTQ
jgi:hypothetical protein